MSETLDGDQIAVVRVMLVDDHDIWRDGVRSMLRETEFQVVGEAENGRDALGKAIECSPTIILLDIRMAGGDGFEALAALKKNLPQAAVLMLTTYDNPTFMARAVAGGASGYLLKGVRRAALIESLRSVANGETLLTQKDLVHSLRGIGKAANKTEELFQPLTDREMEVLKLMAAGLNNRDIGSVLFIAEGTVKTHVEHIIGKVGVSDRVQAAVWAARNGLLDDDQSK